MKHLVTIFLVLIILVLAYVLKQQARNKDKQERIEYEKLYDSLGEALNTSEQKRILLETRYDSISNLNTSISFKLKSTEKELKNIRGRYKNIKADSLGRLMDDRAWKAREN